MAKLLDTISATVRAAYSIRKLKESYSGYAIRVKRTSGGATLDVGFDSNGKLDIAAIAAFETSALTLNKYYDQSGNGFDLPSAGSAEAAISVSGGVLTITGTANTKWYSGVDIGTVAAPKVFAVVNPTTVSGNNYLHDFKSNNMFTAFVASKLRMYNGAGILDFSETVTTGIKQVTTMFQAGTDTARINGVDLTGAANAGDASWANGTITLGGYQASDGYNFAGAIFEWIYIEGAVSNTDRDAIETSQYNNLVAADATAPTVTTFTATANSSTQITIAYAATDNLAVSGWDLDWSANGSTGWTSLLSNVLTASPYIHTGLSPSTAYYYRFRARDAAGNVSSYSTANATTAAVTALTAIKPTRSNVAGRVPTVSDLANYQIGINTADGIIYQRDGANIVIVGTVSAKPRLITTASAATLTPNIDITDLQSVTALAVNMTIAAPTGTPSPGQPLMLRILDSGASRTLTWDAIYKPIGVTLPAATTAGKLLYVRMVYNAVRISWDVLNVNLEA